VPWSMENTMANRTLCFQLTWNLMMVQSMTKGIS
jgi:hypothetical protein